MNYVTMRTVWWILSPLGVFVARPGDSPTDCLPVIIALGAGIWAGLGGPVSLLSYDGTVVAGRTIVPVATLGSGPAWMCIPAHGFIASYRRSAVASEEGLKLSPPSDVPAARAFDPSVPLRRAVPIISAPGLRQP
jgi:hypothetical protein